MSVKKGQEGRGKKRVGKKGGKKGRRKLLLGSPKKQRLVNQNLPKSAGKTCRSNLDCTSFFLKSTIANTLHFAKGISTTDSDYTNNFCKGRSSHHRNVHILASPIEVMSGQHHLTSFVIMFQDLMAETIRTEPGGV